MKGAKNLCHAQDVDNQWTGILDSPFNLNVGDHFHINTHVLAYTCTYGLFGLPSTSLLVVCLFPSHPGYWDGHGEKTTLVVCCLEF